jgi:DNA polymerase-1
MILIEREKDLKDIFTNSEILGVDTETTGLCPIKDKLRLVQLSDGSRTMVIDVFKTGVEATSKFLKPILENKTRKKTLHNAKFDTGFFKQQLNIDTEGIYDSFLASVLIRAGVKFEKGEQKGYHGLEQVAKRVCDIDISKDEQLSDWSGVLSENQLQYAAKDAEVLVPVREEQIKLLKELKLTKAAKLEFDAVLPVAWQELSGFYLDIEEWCGIAAKNEILAAEAQEKIFNELKPYVEQGRLFDDVLINLDSWQQVDKYFKLAGVPMPVEGTKEFYLTPLTKDYPILQWLLDYRGYTKAVGTFGESFREFINPITGRIHCDIFQLGSITGRMAAYNPNMSQIPADKEHRGCFKAEKGSSIVSFDFSQEELRILADISGDKTFIKLFHSGQDFHTVTASRVFKRPIESITEDERYLSKRVSFGAAYCAGPGKLSMIANIPFHEAQMIIKMYFDTFKGVKRWMDYQKVKVIETRCARSMSGRLAKYDVDIKDQQKRAEMERYSVNFPIQATGADILKLALRYVYEVCKPYGRDIKLVNVVHDELDLEIKDELLEEVCPKIKAAMVAAGEYFVQSVPIVVGEKISKVWVK